MSEDDVLRRRWLSRARRLQWRINANWWLERFWPLAFGLSLVFACLLLWFRQEDFPLALLGAAFGAALLLVAVAAAWWARKQAVTLAQALVRLEDLHGLHNRLSSAQAGVGPWPPYPGRVADGWRQRWSRVGAPLLVAALLLAAALWIPLPEATASIAGKAQEPVAWTQMQSWLDTLSQDDALAPEALDRLEAQLDDLRSKPPEQWYGHGSLEAGENLREQTAQAIQSMQQGLASAESALERLSGPGGDSAQAVREAGAQLQAATDALGAGNLPLSSELLKQMRQLDPSQFKQMDPKKMAQLRKQLSQAQKTCSQCQGGGLSEEALRANHVKRDEGTCKGGIDRGPGATPLTLMVESSEGAPAALEPLSNDDTERLMLGDAIGTTSARPEVDAQAAPDPAQAGKAASPGSGGEAVWRQSLTPEESHVLERFFD